MRCKYWVIEVQKIEFYLKCIQNEKIYTCDQLVVRRISIRSLNIAQLHITQNLVSDYRYCSSDSGLRFARIRDGWSVCKAFKTAKNENVHCGERAAAFVYVSDFLDKHSPIGRSVAAAPLPHHWLDINLMDIFFWSHDKNVIYANNVSDIDEVKSRISRDQQSLTRCWLILGQKFNFG